MHYSCDIPGVMKKIYPAVLVLATLLCACTPDVPPPPVERNDLVVRFFRSLRQDDGNTAAMQCEKLYAMEKRNYFLLRLISVQQANNYVRAAQNHLDAGNLEAAVRELESGLKRYPGNEKLLRELGLLRKLRMAEKFFLTMRTAPNPTAMNAALVAARTGLDGIESRELTAFFNRYAKSIERWNSRQIEHDPAAVKVPIRTFDDK